MSLSSIRFASPVSPVPVSPASPMFGGLKIKTKPEISDEENAETTALLRQFAQQLKTDTPFTFETALKPRKTEEDTTTLFIAGTKAGEQWLRRQFEPFFRVPLEKADKKKADTHAKPPVDDKKTVRTEAPFVLNPVVQAFVQQTQVPDKPTLDRVDVSSVRATEEHYQPDRPFASLRKAVGAAQRFT